MNSTDKIHAKALQDALLALDPSGSDGFEGLLGVVLGEITGQSFRLAKSGTQRGRDGDSAFDGGATYFEGKRYKEGLSKNEISAKLFDIANDDEGMLDLWILGATCEVPSQTVEDARKFAARQGFGIAVLDWSNIDLGALLIATVAAGEKSKDFIPNGLKGKPGASLIAAALDAIDHFAKHPDFQTRLSTLRAALTEDAGLGYAKEQNQAWLDRIFSSKAEARAEFGQPLSPRDPSGPLALDRPERARLQKAFSGPPEKEVYAVIGEEGVGKSWLTVKSWELSDPKSLLVMCPADDLIGRVDEDFDTFLIRKLIYQTGGHETPQAIPRWRRRFDTWRKNPASSIRVTLVVDGLNQSLKSRWGRWLDRAALRLKELGGCLVLTTRPQHWTSLKSTISCSIEPIPLGEWTISEVKQILDSRGIDYSKARNEVLESIRNPRLLGITIELVEAKAIELLEELSVGRLLFEHMRGTEKHGATPISALEFADLLKGLAAKVLDRANAQVGDDLRLFDTVKESQLELVASSRFFSPVSGTASQYEIKPEGLNLALALYLVSELAKELRNRHDPRERLATILEPISALDETAKVVLLATQIACLDEVTSPEVSAALIEKFVSLQNLPNRDVDAFAALAKSVPLAFLEAAEKTYLSQDRAQHDEWLLYALINRRDDPDARQLILKFAKRWLSFYSLAPERQMHRVARRDPSDEVAKDRSRALSEIEQRMAALTEAERNFIKANLIEAAHPEFDRLSRFAFHLLAGMPLEEVAPYLVGWRFSYALNSSTPAPYEEFEQLLHYNRVDWQQTRSALLKALDAFPEKNSSRVGKWARVGVLYATGDAGDARGGARIRDDLTLDQERFKGWSIKETYSSVDPCDPNTTKPDNVIATAEEYRQIDPANLATDRAMRDQDHFFRGARAAVTRFMPEDAIFTHRALADDVLIRTGYERRQGVLELLRHSAALRSDQIQKILTDGTSSAASHKGEKNDRDAFLAAQFSLIIALPHLTAEEQWDAIAKIQGETLLLELLSCMKRSTPEKVEQVLERVLHGGSENAQVAVVAAIHYSRSPLTPRAASIVKSFIPSTNKDLRHEALAVAASSEDTALLQNVVDSRWHAEKPGRRDSSFEDWHGSSAILKALQRGLIEAAPALDRMNLTHYGFAAQIASPKDVDVIAARIEAALAKALGYEGEAALPDIVTNTPEASDLSPPLISLTERPPTNDDFEAQMRRFSETDEQFDERQRRITTAYERFAAELTEAEADLIVTDLTFGGIRAIIGRDAGRDQRWLRMLSGASDSQLRHLHHIALQVAIALGANGAASAPEFISRLLKLDPTIRRVSGLAKIPVESLTLWSNASDPAMLDVCKERLRTPRNDADIAREAIAAHHCGKADNLQAYVDELLLADRPYETALALMIAGFSDPSDHAEQVLSRFKDTEGFIGTAHAAASDAYARNVWARTWHAKMRDAQRPEDFWRASVLFMKVVDGRFDIWSDAPEAPSPVFTAFMPTISREISNRATKIEKKREAKLFGEKAPTSIMLNAE